MTEKEAKEKYCPFGMNGTYPRLCKTVDCMAWDVKEEFCKLIENGPETQFAVEPKSRKMQEIVKGESL